MGDLMWKYITGYEGMYSISTDGRVYSHTSDKIRKTKVNNSGYELISLYKDGKERTLLVHRLVAKEFCEGFEVGLVVNHKDSNKLNNNSSNLEWISQKENIRDNMDRGVFSIKEAHAAARLKRKKKVRQSKLCGEFVKEFDSVREAAAELGVGENHISRCARGVAKSAYGFKWEYVENKA